MTATRKTRCKPQPVSPQRLVTIETDDSITTLSAHLTPCQAEAVFGVLKALMRASTSTPCRTIRSACCR